MPQAALLLEDSDEGDGVESEVSDSDDEDLGRSALLKVESEDELESDGSALESDEDD